MRFHDNVHSEHNQRCREGDPERELLRRISDHKRSNEEYDDWAEETGGAEKEVDERQLFIMLRHFPIPPASSPTAVLSDCFRPAYA